MRHSLRSYTAAAAAGVALLALTGGAAWAGPGGLPSPNSWTHHAPHAPSYQSPSLETSCPLQDTLTESGASDIIGGSARFDQLAGGGGTFVFNFALAADSCADITYRAEVYDAYGLPVIDAVSTPLATGEKVGDGSGPMVSLDTVAVPVSYDHPCVAVVVRTLNAEGVTLDRAPDLGSTDGAIAVCDDDGPGQLWR